VEDEEETESDEEKPKKKVEKKKKRKAERKESKEERKEEESEEEEEEEVVESKEGKKPKAPVKPVESKEPTKKKPKTGKPPNKRQTEDNSRLGEDGIRFKFGEKVLEWRKKMQSMLCRDEKEFCDFINEEMTHKFKTKPRPTSCTDMCSGLNSCFDVGPCVICVENRLNGLELDGIEQDEIDEKTINTLNHHKVLIGAAHCHEMIFSKSNITSYNVEQGQKDDIRNALMPYGKMRIALNKRFTVLLGLPPTHNIITKFFERALNHYVFYEHQPDMDNDKNFHYTPIPGSGIRLCPEQTNIWDHSSKKRGFKTCDRKLDAKRTPEEERRSNLLRNENITPTKNFKTSNYKIATAVLCAKLCCVNCADTHLGMHDKGILTSMKNKLKNPAYENVGIQKMAFDHCVSAPKLLALKTWTYEWDSEGAVPWSIEAAKKRSVKPKPKSKPKPAEED